MLEVYLFDPSHGEQLWPFSLLTSPATLPLGHHNIIDQYRNLGCTVHLLDAWPTDIPNKIIADAHILPDENFVRSLQNLSEGQGIEVEGKIAFKIRSNQLRYDAIKHSIDIIETYQGITLNSALDLLHFRKRTLAAQLSEIMDGNSLFVHPTATADHVHFDMSSGPIYIDAAARVMAGSCIKGPVYIGKNTLVKMGTTIYGPTHIGDACVVNGEVNRSQLMFGANKGHEGYIGDSILGRFTNLGALTTTSNLRNNFTNIRIFDRSSQAYVDSDLQKCGLLLGDYSRTAIHTKTAAGTTIGVSCNLVSDRFLPKYVDSFTWLHGDHSSPYQWEKAKQAIEQLHEWKNSTLSSVEKTRLKAIHQTII